MSKGSAGLLLLLPASVEQLPTLRSTSFGLPGVAGLRATPDPWTRAGLTPRQLDDLRRRLTRLLAAHRRVDARLAP